MVKRITYSDTQNRWHSRAPGHSRNDETRAALGVPSETTDAQGDDGGEADAFKEEGQA